MVDYAFPEVFNFKYILPRCSAKCVLKCLVILMTKVFRYPLWCICWMKQLAITLIHYKVIVIHCRNKTF